VALPFNLSKGAHIPASATFRPLSASQGRLAIANHRKLIESTLKPTLDSLKNFTFTIRSRMRSSDGMASIDGGDRGRLDVEVGAIVLTVPGHIHVWKAIGADDDYDFGRVSSRYPVAR